MNLIEIFELFPTEDDCLSYLAKKRWKDVPHCTYCNSTNITLVPKEKRYHCNSCNTSFSVTVGTIFHNTKLPLQKWFLAVCLMLNAKKGLSARQLSRDLKVNKDTAWRISMKIREAMLEPEQQTILRGIVEADETYIGGKPRKMHSKDNSHPRGRGTNKTPVLGMVEHNGKVKARVVRIDQLQSRKLQDLIRRNVDIANAFLITDEFKGYIRIKRMMPHKTVNHYVWHVDGDAHTTTIESFWALLKRGIVGQYHKVSLHYLPRYITEFC